MPLGDRQPARFLGLNHVALEVDDVDAALAFYRRLMAFDPGGRHGARMAFLDAGDQFLALAAAHGRSGDGERHFGLVVDDRAALRDALRAADVEVLPGRGLDFRDPWGNRVQVVQYDEIRFTKAPAVVRAMGVAGLSKTPAARAELAEIQRSATSPFGVPRTARSPERSA